MSPVSPQDILAVAPMLIVILTGMLVLMVDLALPRDRKSGNVVVSLIGLAIAFLFCGKLFGQELTAFNGSVTADDFAIVFQGILVIVAVLAILLSEKYIQQKGINYGEYYALLLFSTSGAMLMATSRELITIFIGLEVLSIALYVLSGFARTEARSEESAMKYFLLGSFSSGFFLYGIALVYGGTGTTRLDLLMALPPATLATPYTVAGIALLIVGLGFKAGLVPFHQWTPDVYEGAPTSVTAFMSAGAKCGAFAAFIRIIFVLLPLAQVPELKSVYQQINNVLWLLAVLTMIVGNVVAVQQNNIKRMLAYSSVAHAGYILVGLLAQNPEGQAGVLFYVLAYTFMNLGAFGVLIWLARQGDEPTQIEDLRGLAQKQPVAAALMAIFMLSLGGIPPTAGFMGKFYLFFAAVNAHQYALAVIGLLASVVGVFYYLRVIVSMYFEAPKRDFPTNLANNSLLATVALYVCALMTLVLGVYSTGLYTLAQTGAGSLDLPRLNAPTHLNAPTAAAPSPPAVERASIR